MADVNIDKFTTQILREGSTPSSPGFVVSEGQDPVNPPGTNNFVPYSGATSNVELGEFGLETGFINLDTTPTGTPTTQGTIFWDADDETVDIILNGYTMKIGEDLFYPVKNQTGSTIAKGVAVRFNGTVGASGRLLIAPFIADGSVPSSRFMGVTAEEILNGEDGKVLYFGRVRGINTDAFNEGDILYASTTVAGGFQTAIPLPPNNIVQIAAVVTKSATVGTIFVRPTLGSNINADEGVKITSVADKNLLQYQSATSLWENKTLAQVLGGTASQFVKGDGSLDSTSYQPLLTNPVTGTGTTNRLAKFTGASTIGDSNISAGGSTIFNENPTAGQFAWQFNGNTTTGQSFGANVVAGTNSSDIALRVLNASASTTHLLVKGDGNVIIGGTTDNGSKLQVSGTATITGSTNQQLVLDFTTASGGFTWQSFRLNGTNRYRIFGNTDNSFTLWSDVLSSNVLSIASTGAATFSSSVTAAQFLASSSSNAAIITSTGTTGYGLVAVGSSGGARDIFLAGQSGFSNGFTVQYTGTEMRYGFQNGNVLIGTTTDNGAKLQVSGTSTFSGELNLQYNNAIQTIQGNTGFSLIRLYGGNGSSSNVVEFQIRNRVDGGDFSTIGNFSNHDLQIRTNNSTRMTIASSGNVGIGTSNPNIGNRAGSSTLTVRNNSTFGEIEIAGSASTQGGVLSFYGDTTRYAEMTGEFESSTNGMMIFRTRRSGTITEAMRVTSGGVLGFNGSSSPGNAGLDKMSIGYLNGNYGWIQTWNSTPLIINPLGNNVLIGTTTDVGARLHVNGDVRTAAPTGGSAVNWRLGTVRGGTVTPNATVRVEIGGVLVDLDARYV